MCGGRISKEMQEKSSSNKICNWYDLNFIKNEPLDMYV